MSIYDQQNRKKNKTHSGEYIVKNITHDGLYVNDFLNGIKNTPELKYNKFIPWFLGIKYVEKLLKNGAEIYGIIDKNKKLVGGILLSNESAPRNTKTSREDKNRKATFDRLHDEEGYKYASYGFIDESERGKISIKEILEQIDQKFYASLRSKSVERLFRMSGGEKILQNDGTELKHLKNGSTYIKYNSNNKK